MAIANYDMTDNHLLALLPPQDRERWRSSLRGVALAAGQVLQEAGQSPRHVYFPLDAVVSLQVQLENGSCDEVAIVGSEGMVGVSIFTGDGSSAMRSVVQIPGIALRLGADSVRAELHASRAVLRLLLQYVAAQEAQLAQGVVCSRHHKVQQRLALRLLLGTASRHDNRLAMTHEQLSGWLGVRRESVSEEALKLQKAGLIAYSRGRITVLDRRGLERHCCECYSRISSEYQRLEDTAVAQRTGTRDGAGALPGFDWRLGVAPAASG